MAATVPNAQLAFGANRAGIPVLEAVLKDETEKKKLLDALGRNTAAGRVHVDVRLDPQVASAGWLARLDDLLAPISVPGGALRIDGMQVELAGALAAGASGWRSRLQRQLGPAYNVEVFNADASVTSATDAYLRAMAHIVETDRRCAAPDIAAVLNLQVVGFASSSGHVPASAKESLTEAAQLMKACADGGHPMRLTLSAFSDNAGNADANLQLSQKRAQAVRDVLVNAGAPADQLTAKGYGRAQPVASNLTPGGRFANRRIVFEPDGR
jgi:outer membrane protein OmpA-like peptidoglycan-associated protein